MLPATNNNIIQGLPGTEQLTRTELFSAEHHPFFEPKIPGDELFEAFLPAVFGFLKEEPQTAPVDAKNRDVVRGAEMPGAEHGPIAADRNQQVKFPGVNAFAQFFIVERTMRSFEPQALQVGRNGSRLSQGIGQLGVAGDDDFARDESGGHALHYSACWAGRS